MSVSSSVSGLSSLQYLQRPQPNGQPATPAPVTGGNDHDGDEIGGVDVGTESKESGRVDIKA